MGVVIRSAALVAAWSVVVVVGPLAAQVPDSVRAARDSVPATDSAGVVRPQYVLDSIVVIAPRERASAPPVATIEVAPRTIQATGAENPYDLIRRVAGLEVHDQGQGPGFASNVVVRGFTADHSSDLLLVVDGVPVNLPVHGHVEGYADWDYLLPGAISSLRVIHGPSSPLYGDFSVAGTAEVYTAADADGTAGRFSGNAFGDLSGWATTGVRGEHGGGLVGLELRRFDGWRANSDQKTGNALLRGWRQVGSGRLEGGLALYRADWSSPGFLSIADFETGDLENQFSDVTDGGDQKRGVLHGRYAVGLGDDRFLQVMGWGVLSDWGLSLTVPGHVDASGELYQTTETDRRWGAGGRTEFSWIPGAGELTVGIEARHDGSEYDLGRSLRRVTIEEEVALDAIHTSVAGYVRWRFHPFERLGVDLGARVDHIRNRSYNRIGLADGPTLADGAAFAFAPATIGGLVVRGGIPEPTTAYHVIGDGGPVGEWISGSHTLLSPKLGLEFRLSDRLSLMASTSRGFRSAVGVVGDPDRTPVVAWAHEVGLDYDRPAFTGHLSLFRTDVSNERIQDPITLEIASSGSSVRQGVEAIAEVGLVGGLRLRGRATLTDAVLSGRYADAHDDHNQPGDGTTAEVESPEQDVPGIADYLASAALEIPIWRTVRGRVEWRITGPYVPIGEPDVRTDPYATLDAGLGFALTDALIVDVEVRNALDRVYPELRSSGYISPGTPRSFALSLQLLAPGR